MLVSLFNVLGSLDRHIKGSCNVDKVGIILQGGFLPQIHKTSNQPLSFACATHFRAVDSKQEIFPTETCPTVTRRRVFSMT